MRLVTFYAVHFFVIYPMFCVQCISAFLANKGRAISLERTSICTCFLLSVCIEVILLSSLHKRQLASVYILCRALIEIVKSFTSKTLPDDLGENLEEIVFNQLKKADP